MTPIALSLLTPLAPLPMTPMAPAPQAHINTECVSDNCFDVLLSADESLDTTSVSWSVDGVFVTTNWEFTMPTVASDLQVVELVATGPGGTDTTQAFLVAGAPIDVPTLGPVMPMVVAGVTSCKNGFVTISTVGGCFTNANNIDQAVQITRRNTPHVASLKFNRGVDSQNNQYGYVANDHNMGGAAWELPTMGYTEYWGGTNSSTYGQSHSIVTPLGNPHLTSYTPVQMGDQLQVSAVNQYIWTTADTTFPVLTVDCSTITPAAQIKF